MPSTQSPVPQGSRYRTDSILANFILEIPRVGLRWVVGVISGDGAAPCGIPQKALDKYGIVLSPNYCRPGEAGVAVLAAHRYRLKPFADLDRLRPGDPIRLSFADGSTLVYLVDRLRIVAPDNVQVLEAAGAKRPELRIITCLRGSNAARLVIYAHLE